MQNKVVVVEDERIVAIALEEQLSRAGYEVVGNVASGEDAIEVVRKTDPDVVLMDVRLAGHLDGIEAALRLEQFSDVGVIFLTAYSDDELIARARKARPYGYLVKPVASGALRPAIEMALVRRAANRRRGESVIAALDTVIEELRPAVERVMGQTEVEVCRVCYRARGAGGDWQDLSNSLETQIEVTICGTCDTEEPTGGLRHEDD